MCKVIKKKEESIRAGIFLNYGHLSDTTGACSTRHAPTQMCKVVEEGAIMSDKSVLAKASRKGNTHDCQDSGFRVQGSGFRVQGSGFRVQGSGFRVQGSGFRVQGSGFRAQGSGFRVQGSGFRVQGSGFRVQGSGFRVQGSGCRV